MSDIMKKTAEFLGTQPFKTTRITIIENGESETLELIPEVPCRNVYSVAKTFAMTAAGFVFDEGLLSPDEKICDILKDEIKNEPADSRWYDVTVEHCLAHKAGLPGGFLDIDVTHASAFGDDYLAFMLKTPLEYNPGEGERYSDGAYYLVSRVVTAKTGKKLDDYMWEKFFLPAGFREAAWSHCPKGYPMGATGLYVTSEDMAKLGKLYLDRGVLNGRQILSEKWIDYVLAKELGLGWNEEKTFYAKGGMCGQKLAVYPSKNRVLAIQSFGADTGVIADFIDRN